MVEDSILKCKWCPNRLVMLPSGIMVCRVCDAPMKTPSYPEPGPPTWTERLLDGD